MLSPPRTTTVLGEHLSQLPASSIWADLWPAALSGGLETQATLQENAHSIPQGNAGTDTDA